MSRAIVMILIFVLSLTVLVSAPHAQGVPPSDRSTGDGGPIQADQYGPPLGVGKAPTADKRTRDRASSHSEGHLGHSLSRNHQRKFTS
jgi:hypothetical protein